MNIEAQRLLKGNPKSNNFNTHREEFPKNNAYTIHTPVSQDGININSVIITGYRIDTNLEFNCVVRPSKEYKSELNLTLFSFNARFEK